MAVMGLEWGEIGIGSTAYGGVIELSYPTALGMRIVDVAPKTTSFYVKEMGHLGSTVSGIISMVAANVPAFIATVRTGTSERKISWLHGSEEQYGYAYSGDVTEDKCVNYGARGNATRIHEVSFVFPLARSMVYKASDNSVLWGS